MPFDAATLFLPPFVPLAKAYQPLTSPPRMVSDQLINVFFQEWAPLFPIVHRPTFLRIYQDFLSDPILKDPRQHAQIYLVFGIATWSSMVGDHSSNLVSGINVSQSNLDLLSMYEAQWRKALDAAVYDTSLETLQCLVLAQIYCIVKGDQRRLVHYTGVAVSMAHRLGLHQSQQRFNLGALTRETRKKVFWSLYTLDW